MKSFSLLVFFSLQSVLLHAFAPTANQRQMCRSVSFATSASSSPSSPSQLMMSAGGVVITGAAGGVGFAYAGEFMDRGYDVVICDVKDCKAAAAALEKRHPNGRVFHTKCDVSDAKSVDKLGQFAKQNLGTVNYWINNAGVNGGRRALRDVPVSQVELVVKVNLLGILLCTKVAMDIMAEQVSQQEKQKLCLSSNLFSPSFSAI
jgi:chlorophyll(ide) b reductase